MFWASVLTAPFGLTELAFVPKYWNPPSLLDLAHRTGFDIESFIFCFAIGGLALAGYRVLVPAAEFVLPHQARTSHWHRWHLASIISPFLVFGVLLILASVLCRPDLRRSTMVGGVVFLALYTVFLIGLKMLWPSYIEMVWNLGNLITWRPAGLPPEELLFGFGFGMYWSNVYEHVTWRESAASSRC
jgi:hypothetical protein